MIQVLGVTFVNTREARGLACEAQGTRRDAIARYEARKAREMTRRATRRAHIAARFDDLLRVD
jgi:hypothetical protein